jgi:hypothetical protein
VPVQDQPAESPPLALLQFALTAGKLGPPLQLGVLVLGYPSWSGQENGVGALNNQHFWIVLYTISQLASLAAGVHLV